MVARRILVPPVRVRILPRQLPERTESTDPVLSLFIRPGTTPPVGDVGAQLQNQNLCMLSLVLSEFLLFGFEGFDEVDFDRR